MDKETILARWMAGEISDVDFKQQVSEEDYIAYVKLRQALQLYEHTQAEMPETVYQNIKLRISKPEKSQKVLSQFKIAMMVAAVLLLMFTVNRFLNPTVFSVETAYGETQKVVLPDGSVAWLGARSKLSYNKEKWDYGKSVKLNGVAYFEVKKGQSFSVVTPNGSVTVLGTKFEVKSISDLFYTVCFEGEVFVHTLEQYYLLKAGQAIQKHKQTLHTRIVSENRPDLLSETIRFYKTPLFYVLKEIENQYHITFENNGVDMKVLFTGTIPQNNLKLSLNLLSKALNIKYKQARKHTIILEP